MDVSCGIVISDAEKKSTPQEPGIRSMNQGKLYVVKQEIPRLNTDILGISELKWTGIGESNSDDPCIYYCGQGSHRRNGVALKINESKMRYLVATSKMTE